MTLANITPSEIKEAVRLLEKKQKLQSELQEVDSQLAKLGGGASSAPAPRRAPKSRRKARGGKRKAKAASAPAATPSAIRKPAAAKKPAKRGKGGKRGRTGALKEKVIGALKAAGAKGITVKELSGQLGVKPQNLFVWFNATGKKDPNVVKLRPGAYRYKKA